MKADCHIHAVLDGVDWKQAIRRHQEKPDLQMLRRMLESYRQQGYTYLRDGGDRWGAGIAARELAAQYGITYRTPGAPLCMQGHYGSFIGVTYTTLGEYAELVRRARAQKLDFIKIMISGLMDFDRFGVLTEPPLEAELIRQLVRIAHEEGMAVMAHANAESALAAAEAGVDSVEHGGYLPEEALYAMAQSGTVWVPTLSTVGNLRGKGRFRESAVRAILEDTQSKVAQFASIGGLIAPGTDAGAWAVPHGSRTELTLLRQCGVTRQQLEKGIAKIAEKF